MYKRQILWNCFYNLPKNESPTFGLNFIKNFSNKNKEYLLICGFETFDNVIIRIDILERLFLKIIELSKQYKFELNSEILNLLGCTKDDFKELMKKMNYKCIVKEEKMFFKYYSNTNVSNKGKLKTTDSPFDELKKLKII